MNTKNLLYQHCEAFLEKRLETVQATIKNLQNALQSETKSTAGDKHETGRAMVQLEREKAGQQLAEIQKVKAVLNKVDTAASSTSVSLGSVVYTTQHNYYIAISAGKLECDNTVFYAISPATPIARLLLSKTTGDSITFGNSTFQILKVL